MCVSLMLWHLCKLLERALLWKIVDLAWELVRIIHKIISKYKEGRIIFDRYITDSLKAEDSCKKIRWCWCYKISDLTLIPLKTLLFHVETKLQLTEYLGKALLKEYVKSPKSLVIVYGNSTYSNKPNVIDPIIRMRKLIY